MRSINAGVTGLLLRSEGGVRWRWEYTVHGYVMRDDATIGRHRGVGGLEQVGVLLHGVMGALRYLCFIQSYFLPSAPYSLPHTRF